MNHVPEHQRGISKPRHCCRGKKTCDPLAQICSKDDESFICLGRNDGSERTVEQDRMTFCFKNEASDDEWDVAEWDVLSMMAVLTHGFAVDNCIETANASQKRCH